MEHENSTDSSLVLSYLSLRKAIGYIGIALPFVLAFGNLLLPKKPGMPGSISAYYYTNMGNVFVGSLCAIGIFLFSYRGYDEKDNRAGNLACLFALGVAMFPPTPEPDLSMSQNITGPHIIGIFHQIFAASLFLTLAYFCLKLFTKSKETDPIQEREPVEDRLTRSEPKTPQKDQRNTLYEVCGYGILICIGLIIVCEGLFLNT